MDEKAGGRAKEEVSGCLAPPKDYLADFPLLLRRLLWSRGLSDQETALRYLYPRLSHIENPVGKLKDLSEAISILIRARDQAQEVVVFGDYDVDGASSSALLVDFLSQMGWKVSYYIPHRIEEGYGLSPLAAKKLLEKQTSAQVVVTCDCGISSFEGISFLKQKSLSVIVTDHHEPPERRVAADAILNPKQKDCAYPDKNLAGVGVAFLLVIALRRELAAKDFSLLPFLDLVALGTVCDVAPLRGANRVFVKAGLEVLKQTRRVGLRALMSEASVNPIRLKCRDLGFGLGPRLNAAGRIGDPFLGVNTLLATDQTEAHSLARQLETHNMNRKQLQEEQILKAEASLSRSLSGEQKSVVVKDSSFHLGLVGLIASRLCENFSRPSCVMTRVEDEHELANYPCEENLWKGSLRAPPGFHLAEQLAWMEEQCPDLFVSKGGHALAAGLAVREKDLDRFEKMFEKSIRRCGGRKKPTGYDLELTTTEGLEKILPWLEPVGEGNPAPRFLLEGAELEYYRILKEKHLKFQALIDGKTWPLLHFQSPWVRMFSEVTKGRAIQLRGIVEILENEWRGQVKTELLLKELLELKVDGVIHDGPNEVLKGKNI